MTLITDEVRRHIGMQGERRPACDAVERGAVRRYAQAIMDADPAYMDDRHPRHGGAVAPPLYPAFLFRLPYGAGDPLSERAQDPDFDGLVTAVGSGLPELPLHGMALLNGGAEIELLRYARHGERIYQQSRYADIYERESRSGPMIMVVIETTYETESGEPLMRVKKTLIRR
ncbi:FAS1-like dehydratase domain-containing protein [Cupriavidus basilensis]|uniref:FAS1-like dehydratase domain-containing protein n=1 Tax=Cupriavidus basilensis TaxID=68895 RepID=UPI0007C7B79B|nr:MaoC family dehydratase N-terminal domain-containing protein [Cupriavidus basilensis]